MIPMRPNSGASPIRAATTWATTCPTVLSSIYPPADPPPFAQGAHHDPYAQQGYGDAEPEYEDEFAEEETTGRGRRWMFIVAALVGAVGVGGALAYTYKSFVAPNGGRVPLVKADPNVKVRPETVALLPTTSACRGASAKTPGSRTPQPKRRTTGSDESGGPRRVRTIPITPGGGPPPGSQMAPSAQAAAPPSIPGIMLENMAPRGQQPPQRAAPQQPPQRVTIGQPPPQIAPQEEPQPPPARRAPAPPAQVAKAPPPRAAPPPPGR